MTTPLNFTLAPLGTDCVGRTLAVFPLGAWPAASEATANKNESAQTSVKVPNCFFLVMNILRLLQTIVKRECQWSIPRGHFMSGSKLSGGRREERNQCA